MILMNMQTILWIILTSKTQCLTKISDTSLTKGILRKIKLIVGGKCINVMIDDGLFVSH